MHEINRAKFKGHDVQQLKEFLNVTKIGMKIRSIIEHSFNPKQRMSTLYVESTT